MSREFWETTEKLKSIEIEGEYYTYPLLCKKCGNPLTVGQGDLTKNMVIMCFKCKKYRKYDVEPSRN